MFKSCKKIFAKIFAVFAAITVTVGFASAQEVNFVLKEYGGKVALFCGGASSPLAVYNTSIDSFYPADRELLRDGIFLSTREELIRLIENMGLE